MIEKKIFKGLLALFVILLIAIFLQATENRRRFVDLKSTRFCIEESAKLRDVHKGTEFENFNFYRSCLLNITCISPRAHCPIGDINKLSNDWK